MQSLYADCYAELSDDETESYNEREQRVHEAFGEAVKYIHNKGRYTPSMLTDAPLTGLIDATYKALAEPVDNIEITEYVPAEFKSVLAENTFIFSGFKTARELSEVSSLLHTDDGNLKPFYQFERDVQQIDSQYNHNYLQAEYNYANAASQMATKWKEWEADGDDYDLQYRTAKDDRVREEHAALADTTLPPSDPFWNFYLPPNGWNCRCTAVQVRKGKYPQSDPEQAMLKGDNCTAKPKQKMFRFNPGKQMKIFPDKHPYFPKGCGDCDRTLLVYNPNSPQCQACGAIKKCIERAPRLVKVTKAEYDNGGLLEVYGNINTTTDDYKRIHAAASYFAKQGKHVVITPKFNSPKNCPDYDAIYGSLKGSKYYGKCPDFSVDGKFYEHEGFNSDKPKRAFNNMLKHGLKQSDRLIMEHPNLTDNYMLRNIKGRSEQISEIWLKAGDELRLLYKAE